MGFYELDGPLMSSLVLVFDVLFYSRDFVPILLAQRTPKPSKTYHTPQTPPSPRPSAKEDLFLVGTQRTELRVQSQNNYSCLMLKTQKFSSLFRHYAKYHGLRKDDLEYTFVERLELDDTPEGVQLQR